MTKEQIDKNINSSIRESDGGGGPSSLTERSADPFQIALDEETREAVSRLKENATEIANSRLEEAISSIGERSNTPPRQLKTIGENMRAKASKIYK